MHKNQLPVPSLVDSDSKAIELLRVWIANGKQQVSLVTSVWSDPANWGIMLVDLAKHIALSYQHSTGENAAEVLNRIRQGFDAEWEAPTDEPTGQLLE